MQEPKAGLRIGFVILTWNSQAFLEKCLASVAGLRAAAPAAVVVDNGSSDRSPEIAEEFAARYPDIFSVVRYDENRGTTVSRNEGLRRLAASRPDLYCILDSDTVVNDAALAKLAEEMAAHPEYGLIGPALASSDGKEQMSARSFPTLLEKLYKASPFPSLQAKGEEMERQDPPSPDAESYPVDYLMSACWLLRPEVLEKAGLLDERIFYAPEDAEYCIRVWKAGYQAAFCPGARIVHEWQRLSRKKLFSRWNWEHIKGLAHMFRKHRYCLSAEKLRKSFGK